MRKRTVAAVAATIAISAAVGVLSTPAHAGDVKVLTFPTPNTWGIGKTGWVQTLAYLNGELVTVPCRNALRCNSVVFVHTTSGAKDAELLQQAFRGNAASATFNYNGSVTGFAGTGLKVRKRTSNKTWRITTLSGTRTSDQINGKAVVAEWKGSGKHHRVVAVEYLGTDAFLAKHPLSMSKLLARTKAMAAPTGGAVTLLTDV